MTIAHTKESLQFAKFFDHTLLKPEATAAQIETLCLEARQNLFYSVCVNAGWIPLASSLLKGTDVLPITVVGFPLGATLTRAKALEAEEAIKVGACEIDMVLNVGWLKSGRANDCETDIRHVVKASGQASVKVILETSLLDTEEIALASRLSEAAGAAFIKTSTGFGSRGASRDDVLTMRSSISPKTLIKASGGLRTLDAVETMIAAGASRVGSSSSVQILRDWAQKNGVAL
jgi:deoxyribose-phosphate aldolase